MKFKKKIVFLSALLLQMSLVSSIPFCCVTPSSEPILDLPPCAFPCENTYKFTAYCTGEFCSVAPDYLNYHQSLSEPVGILSHSIDSFSCVNDINSICDMDCDFSHLPNITCTDQTCICSSILIWEYYSISVSQLIRNVTSLLDVESCFFYTGGYSKRSIKEEDPVIFCSMINDKIEFVYPSDNITGTILFAKDQHRFAMNILTKDPYFNIPSDWFDISGTLSVEVFLSGGSKTSFQFPIVGRTTCLFTDCIYCSEALTNFRCLPTTYKYFLISTVFSILFFTLACFPILINLIGMMVSCFKIPFQIVFCMTKRVKKSKGMRKLKDFAKKKIYVIKEEIFDEEDIESPKMSRAKRIEKNDIEPLNFPDDSKFKLQKKEERAPRFDPERLKKYKEDRRSMNSNIKISGPGTLFLLCCLCTYISSASAYVCGTGVTIPSSITSCLRNDEYSERCSVQFNLDFTIQNIGTSACLTIVDSQNKTLMTGFIEYTALTDQISLSKSYWTSDWQGTSQSVHRCAGSGDCTSNKCSKVGDRTADGNLFSPSVVPYPGVSLCHSSCGCASCGGCTLCSSSCLYSGYGIVPKNTVYLVQSLNSRTHTPIITIDLTGIDGSKYKTQLLGSGATVNMNGFSLSIIGNFASDFTEFNSNQVISAGTDSFLYTAAIVNQPNVGNVGDIQGDTLESLTTKISPTSFRYSPSVVERINGDMADTYNFHTSGISQTSKFWVKLPSVVQGNSWSMKEGYLISNVTTSGSIFLHLSSTQTMYVSRVKDTVCPKGQFVDATGCFNCDSGIKFNVTLSSSCRSGIIYVKSTDAAIQVLNPSFLITTSPTLYTIFLKTSRPFNSGFLEITGSESTIRINYNFTATNVQTVSNDTTYLVVDLRRNAQNALIPGSLFNKFQELSSPLKILSSIASYVILLIVIIVVGFLLFKGFMYIRAYHKINNPYNLRWFNPKNSKKNEKDSTPLQETIIPNEPTSLRQRKTPLPTPLSP